MPDIFVPQDTTGMTSYFRMAANRGMIIRYTFEYTDQNRNKLSEFETPDKLESYLKTQNVLDKFATWAEKKGLKRRNLMMLKSKNCSKPPSTAISSTICLVWRHISNT